MNSNIKILFMGTPSIAAKILEGIINAGYNVVGLVCQEDKPVGRKGIITPPEAKAVALKYGVPVFQPHKIREDFEFAKSLDFDLILTCAYGQIVPQGLLDLPRLKSFNIHGSLLPRYRGASPMQSALANGDKVTGVTIMEMIKEMDAGAMLLKEEVLIDEDDNYSSLYNKIASCGLSCALKALPLLISQDYTLVPQDEKEVSFCKKITKEQEHLDINSSCAHFINMVRSLSDIPGGFLMLDDQVFKVFKTKQYSNKTGVCGTITKADKGGLVLQLADGEVSLLEIQKQGKKRMDYRSFLNGEKDILGKVLQ